MDLKIMTGHALVFLGLASGLCPKLSLGESADKPEIERQTDLPGQPNLKNCLPSTQSNDPIFLAKELNLQLKDFYNHLPKKLNSNDIDVSKLFSCFIPVGMSFSKAEALLQDAGFTVYQGPWSHYAKNGLSVRADIDPYDEGIIWRSSLTVFLAPPSAGRYDYISSLSAEFDFSDL